MDQTRVHPTNSLPSADTDTESVGSESYLLKPRPVPGSYIIKIPKDQIYRVPPPENAKLFQSYSRRRGTTPPRTRRCRCLLWTLAVLLLLLAVSVGVLLVVFRPKFPTYTLDGLTVTGFDAGDPEFDVTVRAENPNKKIGIYYHRDGSDVTVSYSDVHLGSGTWPTFYQGAGNVTVFRTEVNGSGVRLSDESVKGLKLEEEKEEVPLEIGVRVNVRVKFGVVWRLKVKVKCHVVVDKLTASSKIVSKTCKTKVGL